MSLDPQLKSQLKQICSMAFSSSTANAFGEVAVGSTATMYCRLEYRTRNMEKIDGNYEVTRSPFLIIDAGSVTPTYDTRIWLPGHSPSSSGFGVKPKTVEAIIDVDGGVQHWEISV